MARVSDVTVGIRADTRDFQKQLKEVRRRLAELEAEGKGTSKTFKTLQGDLRLIERDLKKGKLAGRDATTAIAMLNRQTKALSPTHKTLQRELYQTGRGLGTVRSTMATLAATTIGVRGTMGTFANALLNFTAGGALTLGIVGGLTAVGFAMQFLGDSSKEAGERVDALIDSLTKNLKEATAKSFDATIAVLRAQAAIYERELGGTFSQFAQGADREGFTKRQQFLYDQLLKISQAIGTVERMRVEHAKELADAERKLNEDREKERQRIRRFQEQQRIRMEQMARTMETVAGGLFMDPSFLLRAGLPTAGAVEARRAGMTRQRQEEEIRRALLTMPVLTQGGLMERGLIDASSKLGTGLDETAEKMAAFNTMMISTFSQMFTQIAAGASSVAAAVVQAVGQMIQALIALRAQQLGAAAGPLGALAGGLTGIAGVLFGAPARQPQMAFNMSVNVGRPQNPMALARDREWQAALRESLLVAEAQGFRLVRG